MLETPIEDPGDDRRNVAKVWELAGLSDTAPEAEKGFSMMTPALRKVKKEMEKQGKKFASSRDLPVEKKTEKKKLEKKKVKK